MLTVTLKDLRRWEACRDRYHHLLAGLDTRSGDDEPIPLTTILDVNGLDDTLWVLWRAEKKRIMVRFSADCAERAVERFWPYPEDRRPHEAIAAARKWADGPMDENAKRVRDAAARASFDAAEEYSTEPGDESPPVAAARVAAIATLANSLYLGPAIAVDWAQRAGCATDWIVERLRKMTGEEK